MQCQEIMRRPLECVKSGETMAVAARKMRDSNIGFLPVCDSAGRVLGVVTDRDLVVRGVAKDCSPSDTDVDEVMSKDIVSCRPSDDLTVAERKMSKHQKSRILIVGDDKRPLGVISLSDVATRSDRMASSTLRDVAARELIGDDGKTATRHR